jgi:hypothetical protein
MNHDPGDQRTPGVPGKLGRLQWVDSGEYTGGPGDLRGLRGYNTDPAPLAGLIAVELGIIDGDVTQAARAIAEDEHDGPIHIAHLIAACEFAAVQVGGSMPVSAPGETGDLLTSLGRALRDGGLAGARAAAAALDPHDRVRALDLLLGYCLRPLTALGIDLTDDILQRARQQDGHRCHPQ